MLLKYLESQIILCIKTLAVKPHQIKALDRIISFCMQLRKEIQEGGKL